MRKSGLKKKLRLYLPVLALLLGLGFLLGAQAGSKDDPLVTRTWVDTYVNKQATALEKRIDTLETSLHGTAGQVELWLGSKLAWTGSEWRTMDVTPQLADGRTLIPLRFAGEALGATVDWNNSQKKVTYVKDKKVVVLFMGKNTATVDGVQKLMDTPPTVVEQRFLVPVRFVSEALGAKVDWDNQLKKVTISY